MPEPNTCHHPNRAFSGASRVTKEGPRRPGICPDCLAEGEQLVVAPNHGAYARLCQLKAERRAKGEAVPR